MIPTIKKNIIAFGLPLIAICLFLNVMANYPNHMSYGLRALLTIYCCIHLVFVWSIKKSKSQFFSTPKAIGFCMLLSIIGSFNILNYNRTPELTHHDTQIENAGIYNPLFRDWVQLDIPKYAIRSLAYTFSGAGITSLGASPVIGYGIMSLDTLGLGSFPGVKNILSYYKNPNRNVYSLSDLKALFQYHAAILILLTLGFWVLRFYHRKSNSR